VLVLVVVEVVVVFGDAEHADVAGGFGRSHSNAASPRRRVGLGRHRADGSVAHLMVWDWSGLGALPIDRSR
jgi:hypothetical protein